MNRVFDFRGPVPVILYGAFAAALVFGCKLHTRDNPDVCLPGADSTDKCGPGLTCVDYHCVPEAVGTGGAGGMVDTTGTGGTVDGSGGAVGSGGSAAGGKGSGGTAAGGKAGVAGTGGHAGSGGGGKAGGAGGTPVECTETGTKICQPPAGPLCLAGKCVQCKGDDDCTNLKTPICAVDHTCISCTAAGVNACSAHKNHTACATGGDLLGACVECDKHKDCTGTKPICSQINVCVGCPDNQTCMAANVTLPVCLMTGAQMGSCAECGKDTDCSADPNKPFCSSTGTCVGCDPLATGACAARVPGKPVCASFGACVQCAKNLDCDSKTPVCSSDNNCGPCSADNDCGGRYGPTICMTKDGHCAVDSETIYVQSSAACSEAANAGTPMVPYCSLLNVPAAISSTRNLVVVRGSVNSAPTAFGAGANQIWIVGQQMALIGGVNTGIRLSAGELSVRDIAVSNTPAIGIQSDTGTTLHLQHVTVSNNLGGGILLDGAAFDIQNTMVKTNGPGDMAGTLWGGIRIASPPSSGPKQLQNVTVQGNTEVGISCTTAIQGTGVLASGNTASVQITSPCMITSCAAAGPTCGAQ